MVANTPAISDRFVPPPPPLMDGRWRLVRFTRKDAEALVRQGIVPEDASTELLDGMIVLKDRSARDQDPTMIGPGHRKCVERLSALRKAIDSELRHVESQQPLVCSDIHQPEPDFMVLRGYAKAAIRQYIVINLRNRTAEVYTDPDPALAIYPAPAIVADGQTLAIRIGEAEFWAIPLRDVLP